MQNYILGFKPFNLEVMVNEKKLITTISFVNTSSGQKEKHPEEILILKRAVELYLAGKELEFPIEYLDMSSLSASGKKILLALKKVRFGELISYRELAIRAGLSGTAARFVGNVMARNPFPLVFPCHRVIRSDGSYGMFSGGAVSKNFLIDFEKSQFQGR